MKLRTRLTLGLAGVSLLAAGGLFASALVVLARSNQQSSTFRRAQASEVVGRNRTEAESDLQAESDDIDALLARAEQPGGALTIRMSESGSAPALRDLAAIVAEERAKRRLDVIDIVSSKDGAVIASAHWPQSVLTRTDNAAISRDKQTGYLLVQTPTETGGASDPEGRPAFRIAFARTAKLTSAPDLMLVTGVFADDPDRLRSFAGHPELAVLEAAGHTVVIEPPRDPFMPSLENVELVLEQSLELLPSFDDPANTSRQVTLRISRRDEGAEARSNLFLAFVAIAVALLSACFPAATLLSRRFAAPIDALADGARAIASGNLDHRIPESGSKDEVSELVDAFNGMARDLKDSRSKLLQTERVAAWREIAKRIAHEIKNPLTPIQLAVETTRRAHRDKRPEFDEILEESARAILEEVDSLKKLVKEFSEFARMPDPVLVPDDVNEVVKGAMRVFTGVPDGVNLTSELGDELPRVRLDRDQMTRVLINLVANAVDAVEGKGSVVVKTGRTRDERGDGVEIHVQDDGPGIPADVREKIFTPYFTTKPNGTGLGLAIVQRIVIDHGGEILLTEAPGRGTDFVVRLRAAGNALPAQAPAA